MFFARVKGGLKSAGNARWRLMSADLCDFTCCVTSHDVETAPPKIANQHESMVASNKPTFLFGGSFNRSSKNVSALHLSVGFNRKCPAAMYTAPPARLAYVPRGQCCEKKRQTLYKYTPNRRVIHQYHKVKHLTASLLYFRLIFRRRTATPL